MPDAIAASSQQGFAEKFGSHIENRMLDLLKTIEHSEIYKSVFAPDAEPKYILAVVKYILLEVFSYGPHVTEATFTAIGRIPKNRLDLMQIMIKHDLEEVDHGEMALMDFVKLGGDENWARTRRITPASFNMAATCRMLSICESPYAYLGYMYPFESLTPILTDRLLRVMSNKGFPIEAKKFVEFHAAEDVAHAKVLKTLIERVVRDYPKEASAIEYGFDCFAGVYPMPVWNAAVKNAKAELESR